MCRKKPEQEILINIAILLGIPINGNVYLLAFMGIPYIQKLQRIYPQIAKFLVQDSFSGTFFGQFEKMHRTFWKKRPLETIDVS